MTQRPPPVMLFSRPGCHLCEDAAALMLHLSREYSFTLLETDISTDPELESRYMLTIPVLRFPDGTELSAPLTERDVRLALTRALE